MTDSGLIRIAAGTAVMEGMLELPAAPAGMVLFAHGSALLAERLGRAAAWLGADARCAHLPLGLFGASTGAAAALRLAAREGAGVAAVVSRGDRPDLAGPAALAAVGAPTLLVVGGDDGVVVDLNRQALALLRCDKEMLVIPGASHLFEEPGKLEAVAQAATGWFVRHLGLA